FAMACGAGVLSPLAMLTFNSTQWLLPRYFMVSITFLLLAAGRVIGDAFGRPGYGRAVAGMVLGAYVVGHTMLLADQFRFGRGGYTQVIATILRGPSPGPVSISGGHTLRTRMVLAYYLGLWQQAWKARYVPVEQLTPDGVDWLILQTQEQPLRPAKRATDQHGNHYQLRQVEPTGGLSGFHWMLYQRMPSDPRRPKQPD
ncbi:MAG: hypothetical protein OXU20_36995, partial [Myxococcales bacterium]|nr:hypothetical protein [Myxococcales bacterium]MDD9970285.1 hypothetical protein [Myxococcales bacterium]